MYLGANDQLGIVDAILAVATLKNLFGFGQKKAALKQIEANAAGKWTSQLPPYADWREFLSRPASNAKAKAAGAQTYADEYNWQRGRKDSILIKNQIATPEDYAAWLVINYGLKDGWINPNARPGDALYNNGPYALETKIPIFDYDAIVKWASSQNMNAPQAAPITAVPLNAQTVLPPILQPLQPTLPTPSYASFAPPANIQPQANIPQSASPLAPASSGIIVPLALLGLVGVALIASQKKKRR